MTACSNSSSIALDWGLIGGILDDGAILPDGRIVYQWPGVETTDNAFGTWAGNGTEANPLEFTPIASSTQEIFTQGNAIPATTNNGTVPVVGPVTVQTAGGPVVVNPGDTLPADMEGCVFVDETTGLMIYKRGFDPQQEDFGAGENLPNTLGNGVAVTGGPFTVNLTPANPGDPTTQVINVGDLLPATMTGFVTVDEVTGVARYVANPCCASTWTLQVDVDEPPNPPGNVSQPSIAIETGTNTITHWWDPATQAWIPVESSGGCCPVEFNSDVDRDPPNPPDDPTVPNIAIDNFTNTITHWWDPSGNGGAGEWVLLSGTTDTFAIIGPNVAPFTTDNGVAIAGDPYLLLANGETWGSRESTVVENDTGGDIITDNGVTVPDGDSYLLNPDGTTFGDCCTEQLTNDTGAPFTASNGALVNIGDSYLLLDDGTTWGGPVVVVAATGAPTTSNGVDPASGDFVMLLPNGYSWATPPGGGVDTFGSVADPDVLDHQVTVDFPASGPCEVSTDKYDRIEDKAAVFVDVKDNSERSVYASKCGSVATTGQILGAITPATPTGPLAGSVLTVVGTTGAGPQQALIHFHHSHTGAANGVTATSNGVGILSDPEYSIDGGATFVDFNWGGLDVLIQDTPEPFGFAEQAHEDFVYAELPAGAFTIQARESLTSINLEPGSSINYNASALRVEVLEMREA